MVDRASRARRIGLLGASFETGNMGVSALAETSIKCLLNRWPDAEVVLLDGGRKQDEVRLELSGRRVTARLLPIRFCKNIFLSNHFFVLLFYVLLLKLFRTRRARAAVVNSNPSVRELMEMEFVADITGGDSLSDIYGVGRFLKRFLRRWLIIQFGKELILLPQTYGPFRTAAARAMGRYVLNRASAIYSRDHEGIEYVRGLLHKPNMNGKVRFGPDLAFVLDSREPENLDVGSLEKSRTRDTLLVGFNISGLLFNGGYTQNNMFGLKTDYRRLICSIIDLLMRNEKLIILLVPHVFGPVGCVENDHDACSKVYEDLGQRYKDRLFLAKGEYSHNEIKYIIGKCDFFVGSRMHACIAAVSQGIPAIGLAYSKKFRGVFESIGIEQLVIDMREKDRMEILTGITEALEQRRTIADNIKSTIPKVQEHILHIFEALPWPEDTSKT